MQFLCFGCKFSSNSEKKKHSLFSSCCLKNAQRSHLKLFAVCDCKESTRLSGGSGIWTPPPIIFVVLCRTLCRIYCTADGCQRCQVGILRHSNWTETGLVELDQRNPTTGTSPVKLDQENWTSRAGLSKPDQLNQTGRTSTTATRLAQLVQRIQISTARVAQPDWCNQVWFRSGLRQSGCISGSVGI